MAYRQPVAVGSTFRWNGGTYHVVGQDTTTGALICRLRGSHGTRRFDFAEVVSAPDFRQLSAKVPALDDSLDDLPKHLREKAEAMIAHLLEARTGFRSGSAALALPGEPKPEFDPSVTTLTARMEKKANELGLALSTLYERWKRYERSGAAGVLDGRSTRNVVSLARLDTQVRDAILAVHRDQLTKPRISNKILRLEVEARLQKDPTTAHLTVPPQRSFDRYYAVLKQGAAMNGPTKYQRSRATGPQGPYGTLDASYAGQYVLIDETDVNVWVVDPITLEVAKVNLVLALDGYSRSILAARFILGRPNQRDAAALLRDIVTPKPHNPSWPLGTRWPYVGVPEHVVIQLTRTDHDAIAGVPVVTPQTIVIDNAWIFQSHAFRDGARLLGINVLYARAFTPTDKSAIESTFGTLNENFSSLQAGYKGRDVHSGADMRLAAQRFLNELEEAFWEWVVTFWQPREHEGLYFGAAPRLGLSPNDVYEESLAKVGFLALPLSRDIYFHLLPRQLRAITREGIEMGTLTYDSGELTPLRDTKSPFPLFGGRWPIKYDDRDLTEVYVQNPATGKWLTIPWSKKHLLNQPFGSDTRDIAIEIAKQRGRKVPNQEAVVDALRRIIQRRDEQAPARGKELAAAKREHSRRQQAALDGPPGRAARGSSERAGKPGSANGKPKPPALLPLDEIPRLETLSDNSTNGARGANGGKRA